MDQSTKSRRSYIEAPNRGCIAGALGFVFIHVFFIITELINSQGARNLKIRSAQLTRQKRFDCIDDKNYPSTTFLGTSYGQIVVAIFREQAFYTTTPFCN